MVRGEEVGMAKEFMLVEHVGVEVEELGMTVGVDEARMVKERMMVEPVEVEVELPTVGAKRVEVVVEAEMRS